MHSSEVLIWPLTKHVFLYVRGDFEIYAKFRILECVKYTNFLMAYIFAGRMFSHVGYCLYLYVAKFLELCVTRWKEQRITVKAVTFS